MNKSDLADHLVEKTGLKKKECEQVINAFVEGITLALVKGEKVQLTGFGTFEARERKERPGRNPATGETITVAAGRAPAFKPGKRLKEQVR